MAETLGTLNLGPEGALSFLESEQKRGEKAKGERQKAAEAQILAQEGAYSKPAPDFQPSQESASGFAALGALLAASGAILGSGGRSSGIMAMNAVSGMMNGYNAGRKDLYEQQRQQFEESMKSWEKHRAEVKDAFDRAMKIAPYNLTLAQQSLNRDLVSLGLKPLAEVNQKSGPIAAASAYYGAHENTSGQLAKIMPSLTGGLSGEQKQFFDTLKTTDEKLAYLKAVAADKAAKSAADKEALETQYKQAQIAELKAKAAKEGSAEPALDVGPYAKTILENQTPEKAAETQKFLSGKKTIDAAERKQLDSSKIMLDDSERVAKYIAENPDAAGMLGQALGKSEPVLGIFRTAPKSMDDLDSRIDNGLDAIAKADPSQRATAQKAAKLSKMLAALSLKDAAATGRPTVFLERMISRWYNQGYPPDTLLDIIKERASEADGVLANYKLDTARNKPEVNKQNYPLTSGGVDEYLKQFRKTPAAAGLTELSPAQKTGIQARIDQVNKDPSFTDQQKKDIKDKIRKQLEGKFSDSGLNWGD